MVVPTRRGITNFSNRAQISTQTVGKSGVSITFFNLRNTIETRRLGAKQFFHVAAQNKCYVNVD